MAQITRRDLIATGALAGAGLIVPAAFAADAKPFRVVHMTDMHVQPERKAGEGYTAALQSLSKLSPQPDLLITGGDHIMDAFDEELVRTRLQWELFHQGMTHTKIPWKACLGNHDIFGWGKDGLDPKIEGYGKPMGLDQLKMAKAYYAFDAGGWRFIILDSMARRGGGYFAHLDPEQLEWLTAELSDAAVANKPTVLFSHIPILAACVFFDGDDRLGEKNWSVPDAWMHRDMRELVLLLMKHKVKLAVSGHIHLLDRVEYNGITFICDGAVSGNWWRGVYHETPEGYGVLDLHLDGRFDHRYVAYGWKAEPEPK